MAENVTEIATSNAAGDVAGDRERDQKIVVASADEVAEVVDAITGATWNTRNTIMEDLFHKDLEERADIMPEFRPPGVA